MSYILSEQRDSDDYEDRRMELWNQYQDHLRSMESRFPESAFKLATSNWWYSFSKPEAPHDSYLESFLIHTVGPESTNHLTIKLESSFGGLITLEYQSLIGYNLTIPQEDRCRTFRYKPFRLSSVSRRNDCIRRQPEMRGSAHQVRPRQCIHGDWRFDEFDLSPEGFLVHTIEWCDGPRWVITAKELTHRYDPPNPVTA